jgi:hypothetical protein
MKSTVVGLRNKGFQVRCLEASSHPDLIRQYNVRSVPAFLYVRDGEVVRRSSWCGSEWQLERLCRDTWF